MTLGDEKRKERTLPLTEGALYAEIHNRPNQSLPPLAALCLSGGGIRSATFGLGVMQGLARCGLLGEFTYLSTVSGGGYIGSWLTAWILRKAKTDPDPFGTVIAELRGERLTAADGGVVPEAPAITQLRQYSSYLAPQSGLLSADFWTLIATVLRNIILNWFVLVPVLLAALAVPRLLAAAAWAGATSRADVLIATGFVACAWTVGYASRKRVLRIEPTGPPAPRDRSDDAAEGSRPKQIAILVLAVLPLWFAAVLLSIGWAWRHLVADASLSSELSDGLGALIAFGVGVMFVGWLGYTLSLWLAPGPVDDKLRPWGAEHARELAVYAVTGGVGGVILRAAAHGFDGVALQGHHLRVLVYATVAPPAFVLSFILAATIFVGLASKMMTELDREWWSRFGAWILISATAWAAVSAVVLLLPQALAGSIRVAVAAAATLGSGAMTIDSLQPADSTGITGLVRSRHWRTSAQ